MKKTILYLSLLSTFTIPNGGAMEENREMLQTKNSSLVDELEKVETEAAIELSLKAQRIADLKLALARETEEKNNVITTNETLERKLVAIEVEQLEPKQLLLDDVLQQGNQGIPQEAPPLPLANHIITEIAGTSTYQQLLSQWQQGKIGPQAWAALNGENRSLIAALLLSIKEYPQKTVEIFYLGANNFKLCINGKEQNHPYKF